MRKIIASGTYWVCENMDTLAPIIEEGTEYLLDDNSVIRIDENCKDRSALKGLVNATDEEKRDFARKHYNTIFNGDKVVIARGRKMVGEIKEVKGYFKYEIEGTYGHAYTEYLTFTDGTKVNIDHCDCVGIEYKDDVYMGKKYYHRTFAEGVYGLFSVGGRR